MKVKIIIIDGIIETCLVDNEAVDAEVEVVESDKNMFGNDKIEDYIEELYENKELVESKNFDITRASDEDEDNNEDEETDEAEE